jgi:hypothetical protein
MDLVVFRRQLRAVTVVRLHAAVVDLLENLPDGIDAKLRAHTVRVCVEHALITQAG